jgi:hypothetical protein
MELWGPCRTVSVIGENIRTVALARLILAKLDSPSISSDRTASIIMHPAPRAVRLCPPRKK